MKEANSRRADDGAADFQALAGEAFQARPAFSSALHARILAAVEKEAGATGRIERDRRTATSIPGRSWTAIAAIFAGLCLAAALWSNSARQSSPRAALEQATRSGGAADSTSRGDRAELPGQVLPSFAPASGRDVVGRTLDHLLGGRTNPVQAELQQLSAEWVRPVHRDGDVALEINTEGLKRIAVAILSPK